jgi:hypothetical protein
MGEGGFTGTVGADDRMQLVFVQGQRYVVDRKQATIALAQAFGL